MSTGLLTVKLGFGDNGQPFIRPQEPHGEATHHNLGNRSSKGKLPKGFRAELGVHSIIGEQFFQTATLFRCATNQEWAHPRSLPLLEPLSQGFEQPLALLMILNFLLQPPMVPEAEVEDFRTFLIRSMLHWKAGVEDLRVRFKRCIYFRLIEQIRFRGKRPAGVLTSNIPVSVS